MNRSQLFLKLGLTTLAAAIFCFTVNAQSAAGSPEQLVFVTTKMTAEQERIITSENQNKSTRQDPAETQHNIKNVDPARGPVTGNTAVKGTRNCEPKHINKPYSITRDNFNKLPKNRQQFILSNLNKYTITD